jgi:hypothetical protein
MKVKPATVVGEHNDGDVGQRAQVLERSVRIRDEPHVDEVVVPGQRVGGACA